MPRNEKAESKTSGTMSRWGRVYRALSFRLSLTLLLSVALIFSGCFERNEGEAYYGRGATPNVQEFRWSDGGLPQTFDPALAAVPPDTDAVRALFEGLTDYDPRTLAAVPGVATRWESSEDKREWTFYLRRDARWSNGDAVTANDFVRSWQRIVSLGSRAPHGHLFENIVGSGPEVAPAITDLPPATAQQKSNRTPEKSVGISSSQKESDATRSRPAFGVEAVSDDVLRVRLERPDGDFPALVAHPIFRPVHDSGKRSSDSALDEPVVSNGPFKLAQVADDRVVLERAASYWDASTVNLNRVRFVATSTPEDALERYRKGEIDVITNAGFEPLALKLLAPYGDFRRATFGALTYYKFNIDRAPFSDVRVREALAIAIDRERISEDDMDGASEPARTFLPAHETDSGPSTNAESASLVTDIGRARNLLSDAGFPQGVGFPKVKLLVNRNDQQRLIAQSIATMWRKTLGIDTEIVVKSWDEYETALRNGDYDVARRGVVIQTTDEAANMRLMFETDIVQETDSDSVTAQRDPFTATSIPTKENSNDKSATQDAPPVLPVHQPILTQAEALKQLPAIPIYFASSYSLIRPYVTGFNSNLLDAPSLKRVRIDTSWQAPKQNPTGWFRAGD